MLYDVDFIALIRDAVMNENWVCVCVCVPLSIHLSLPPLCVCLSQCLPVSLCHCLSFSVCLCVSLSISLSLFVSLYLSFSLCCTYIQFTQDEGISSISSTEIKIWLLDCQSTKFVFFLLYYASFLFLPLLHITALIFFSQSGNSHLVCCYLYNSIFSSHEVWTNSSSF